MRLESKVCKGDARRFKRIVVGKLRAYFDMGGGYVRADGTGRGKKRSGARRLVVGYSGGADSLALLHLAAQAGAKLGVEVVALHANHRARDDADAAAARAAAVAETLSVPLVMVERKAAGRSAASKTNKRATSKNETSKNETSEAALRAWRYHVYAQALHELGGLLATGHTADDVVETMLMRLVRGTSLAGLRGIDERMEVGVGAGVVVRPMLTVTRGDVEAYLDAHGLTGLVIDDPTNASDAYLRNRVRASLVPMIAAENPSYHEAFARLALHARDDLHVINTMATTLYLSGASRLNPAAAHEVTLKGVRGLPPGLLRRIVREAAREALLSAGGDAADEWPALERVEAACGLLGENRDGRLTGKVVQLGRGVTAERVRGPALRLRCASVFHPE